MDNTERRGTFWDWPTKWILIGVALLALAVASDAYGFALLGWGAIIFGAIATAIRRGAFSPRRD